MLPETGESLKTAQALLGHSDLETTLNTYIHVIAESQRRAVGRLEELFVQLGQGVLLTDVFKSEDDEKARPVN